MLFKVQGNNICGRYFKGFFSYTYYDDVKLDGVVSRNLLTLILLKAGLVGWYRNRRRNKKYDVIKK